MIAQPTSIRFPAIYLIIVALNIAVFAWQVFSGVDPMTPRMDELIAWGANLAPFSLTGQPWRLFTSMFLHIGLIHIALNMYMLIAFGGLVERDFGRLRFTLVYLLSGLFGSLVSALWYANTPVQKTVLVLGQYVTTESLPVVVAAGASGALMGISGAYLARIVVAGTRGEPHEDISMRGPLVQTIAINLGMGFLIPGVDNACHIGGLVSGAVIGGLFALAGFDRSGIKRAVATFAVSAIAVALLMMGLQRPASNQLLALKAQIVNELANEQAKERANQRAPAAGRL